MILEAVILYVKPNQTDAFENSFRIASNIICTMNGYIEHQLHKCIEVENKYLLLVKWQTLEDHTIGFRTSSEYQEWRTLLHDYYNPYPIVEHFNLTYKTNKKQTKYKQN